MQLPYLDLCPRITGARIARECQAARALASLVPRSIFKPRAIHPHSTTLYLPSRKILTESKWPTLHCCTFIEPLFVQLYRFVNILLVVHEPSLFTVIRFFHSGITPLHQSSAHISILKAGSHDGEKAMAKHYA